MGKNRKPIPEPDQTAERSALAGNEQMEETVPNENTEAVSDSAETVETVSAPVEKQDGSEEVTNADLGCSDENGECYARKTGLYEKLQEFFGLRKQGVLNNTSVLLKRMQCNLGYTKHRSSYMIMDVDKTEKYAEVPRIPLYKVWRIAHSEEARQMLAERAACTKKGKKRGYGLNNADFPLEHGYTEQTWHRDMQKISGFLSAAGVTGAMERPLLISDVWEMNDLDYQTVFLENATGAIRLLQLVILTDTRENARLSEEWKHIRRYLYRVPLEKSRGGVFSDEDAAILRDHQVLYLNDIRKKTIFELKNMFLEHDFRNIIRELNEAFKEDLARRRDRRYKIRPFVTGFLNVTATAVIAFVYRYTLIKNQLMTLIILGLLAICAVAVLFIVIGAIRAKYRRRTKRKDYYYFTIPVKRACKLYASATVFVLLALALFYGRYDGYNETFYYRDLDDGTIAIAGLVKNQKAEINVPETIDDKQVSEIDLCAFYRDDFTSVSLPTSLRKVDRAAFLRCDQLNSVDFNEGLVTVEKNAFRHCEALKQMTLPTTLTTLGTHSFDGTAITSVSFVATKITELPKGVFKNCNWLVKAEGLTQIQKIGESAFDGCIRLSEVHLSLQLSEIGNRAFRECRELKSLAVPKSVLTIGRNAFRNCVRLESVSLPYLGTSKKNSSRQSLKTIMPMTSKSTLVDLTVTDSKVIGSNALKGTDWVHSITLEQAVTDVSARAFKGLAKLKTVNMSPSVKEIGNSAFEGCAALESIFNLNQITRVGMRAFKDCSALTVLDMGAVKTIEREAFLNCSALTTFNGFASVADVKDRAFFGCKSLSDVPFGSSLNSIGKQAFDGCAALKTIVIPGSVTRIGRNAFANTKPDSLTIPFFGRTLAESTSKSLGDVFSVSDKNRTVTLTVTGTDTVSHKNLEGCQAVKHLILGDGVQSIEKGAFMDLPLQTVTLPASVTEIPDAAFQGCSELKQIIGDDHIVTIGVGAFSRCSKLSDFTVDSLKTVGSLAFEKCAELQFSGSWSSIEEFGERVFLGADKIRHITIESEMSYLSDYAFADSALEVIDWPEDSSALREIGKDCFAHTAIQSIQLPEGVTVIHEGAFRNCTNLESVSIPSSLTAIHNEAFRHTKLVDVDLTGTNVSTLGAYAFADCGELVSLSLPDTVRLIPEGLLMDSYQSTLRNIQQLSPEEIGAYAFKNTSFQDATVCLSDGVTRIGEEAFYNTGVTTLKLPASLREIGKNAFASCGYLKVVTIPFVGETVDKVGNGAAWVFGDRNSVTSLEITGMKKVEETTFAACRNTVSHLLLNDEVSKIRSGSFRGFTALEGIRLPQSLEVLEASVFENCQSLKTVHIPTGTRIIRARAFAGCSDLTMVYMDKSSVTKIEKEAFMYCDSLMQIYFPESLVTVKEYAFAGCESLESVTFTKKMKRVHEMAFGSDVPANLNIPEELLGRYWGKFGLEEETES